MVCSDGIILGTEKIVINKMMLSGTDKRVYSVSKQIGAVSFPFSLPVDFLATKDNDGFLTQ